MRDKYDGACKFHPMGVERCSYLASPGKYCPRHSFLIETLGLDGAEAVETEDLDHEEDDGMGDEEA